MTFHELRQLIKKQYTLDNVVLFVAVVIAVSWLWGTMGTLQNNYLLQRQVDTLQQQVEETKLETETLALENKYFESQEYLELQARQRLNKAAPGEHLLLLPANTTTDTSGTQNTPLAVQRSNLKEWINFFFANH
jgi:cell division protein FtsB